METIKNQIVGLVRFSYPSKGGFVRADDTDEKELEAQLYDPDRLERRFALFEALTLPSLLAQQDDDFQTIFLIGKSLPDAARDRLSMAIAPLKGARIVALPPLFHYQATQRAYGFLRDDKCSHFTSFRLDDDDAIDIGFIARLRRTIAGLLPVAGLETPLIVGCNHGFFLERDPLGNRIYDVTERAPIGIGLAMTTAMLVTENIFRRNHRLLPQYYSTFTDAQTPAFIRTVHADNDSSPSNIGRQGALTPEQTAAAIEANFPFKMAMLKAL